MGQIISFNCVLKNCTGHLISTTFNRDVLVLEDPRPGTMLAGLNKNLLHLKKGEKKRITVSAKDAYGLYDPEKVISVYRNRLPKTIQKGELVSYITNRSSCRSFRVVDINPEFVFLDGNHPLAGQDLLFEIEALDTRQATPQEIDDYFNTVSSQLLH